MTQVEVMKMSDNWVVQNLQNALETWNEKLAEIWQLITTTPQSFKGGGIWAVIVNINGAVQAIGLILLGFGIVQVGLSLKSHDPSQRANGFLTLAGGVIITFAKEILTLITG